MATELDPESHHHSPSPSDRRCCFCIPYRWQKVPPSSPNHHPSLSLWSHAFNKLREWSELIAGPRWKTFIRRFNRNKSSSRKFQYDPIDYALNFDQGPLETADSEAENEYMVRNFSSRYVARSPVGVVFTARPELSPGAGT